jgi:prepilin-type N-terminal cleavage/methylation domain-containing protein
MKKFKSSGFTVVELLISITVISIVTLFISNYMLGTIQQSAIAMNRDTLIKETETSLDSMANDVRLSANADDNNRWPDANSPGGSLNQYGWVSGSSTLVLATAAENQSDNIIFSDSHNYITQKNNIVYFIRNSTLYKRVIAAPVSGNKAVTTCPKASASTSCPADKELLHNVTGFTVTYLDGQSQSVSPTDARSIEVHVTVAKSAFKQPVTADYTTRMVFRND